MNRRDRRGDYRKTIELSLMVALVIVALSFRVVTFEGERRVMDPRDTVTVVGIERTEQMARERPPAKPVVPIMARSDELLDPGTEIDTVELDWFQKPPVPSEFANPVVEEKAEVFVPYDTEPSIIGGTAYIQRHLKYPELARQAGVEGKVLLRVTIDEEGQMVDAVVMEDETGVGFGRAALEVLKKCRFTPGMQRDRPVKVSISIPIYFRLK